MPNCLFANLAQDITISRVTAEDAKMRTDLWLDLQSLVGECEAMYPKIDQWVGKTVRAGIQSGQRSGFVAYHNGIPVVSSIVKRGPNAKFCHLKVKESLWGSNVGEFFFALMVMEVRAEAQQIHFTLPESLWEEKKAFFSSFAFREVEKSGRQYRLFDDELHCTARFDNVWKSVMDKLPKLAASLDINGSSQDSDLLMSVHPRFADSILRGRKTVEIRRSFSTRWLGHRIAIYAGAPVSSIVGEAVIEKLVEDTPGSIWNQFGGSIGCTKGEFDSYVSGVDKVFALLLNSVHAYRQPLSLRTARSLVGTGLRPPQSYARLSVDSPWARAIPIAGLLRPAGHVQET